MIMTTTLDSVLAVCLAVYTIGFVNFRIGELGPLLFLHGRECLSALLGTLALRRNLGPRGRVLLHVASLAAAVYVLDHRVPNPPPQAGDGRYAGLTVVVTGANAGVGYETSRQLAVDYGVNVVMGCRNAARCEKAAEAIDAEIRASPSTSSSSSSSRGAVTPLAIDLSDFASVESFVSERLGDRGISVDVLFNNAGYAPGANEPPNGYGYDPSFTSMHLSHFHLAELLLGKNNPNLRVVNTSSGTHHLCALPFALFPSFVLKWLPLEHAPGCIDGDYLERGVRSKTDGASYIRAKVANVLHAAVLPLRHASTGDVTAIAIDLGWVGTSIKPFMKGRLSPVSLGWMRSADVGVRPVLHAILTSREELLAQLGREDRGLEGSPGFVVNVFGRTEEAFSYPWWSDFGEGRADMSAERMLRVGADLWEKSVELVRAGSLLERDAI